MDAAVLVRDRLQFNELVKTSAEQQMLLNIVRLRYADTPSSLAVTSISTQNEVVRSFGLLPIFGAVGNEVGVRGASAVLPQANMAITDRPTLTMTPLDDTEFTRKLFTPMPLEGLLHLAKASWPIATVFRLWLENLNWVPFEQRQAFEPIDTLGRPFDWRLVTRELFQIGSSADKLPPEFSHVAIRYRDHWFYLDRRDSPSMSTLSLLLELARLETSGKAALTPTLTLPLTGR